MSFIGRTPPFASPVPPMPAARRSAWRLFPWIMAAALLLVIAVNGGMIWAAVTTFPGAAGLDGFDASNRYDQVLAAVARQDALGWTLTAEAEQDRPVLRLRDARGQALAGARITGQAERPLGPKHTTALSFLPTGNGRFVADAPLPLDGQWDLILRAEQDGNEFRATRRVLVR